MSVNILDGTKVFRFLFIRESHVGMHGSGYTTMLSNANQKQEYVFHVILHSSICSLRVLGCLLSDCHFSKYVTGNDYSMCDDYDDFLLGLLKFYKCTVQLDYVVYICLENHICVKPYFLREAQVESFIFYLFIKLMWKCHQESNHYLSEPFCKVSSLLTVLGTSS